MGNLKRFWLLMDDLVWESIASIMTAAAIIAVFCEIIARNTLPSPIVNRLAAIKRALYRP